MIFSGVAGISRTSTPAWRSALTIAGAGPSIGISPTPFRAERSVRVRVLEHHDVDRRRIERRRNDVVGELSFAMRAVAHHDVFEQRVADALRRSAFDLPGRQPDESRGRSRGRS